MLAVLASPVCPLQEGVLRQPLLGRITAFIRMQYRVRDCLRKVEMPCSKIASRRAAACRGRRCRGRESRAMTSFRLTLLLHQPRAAQSPQHIQHIVSILLSSGRGLRMRLGRSRSGRRLARIQPRDSVLNDTCLWT